MVLSLCSCIRVEAFPAMSSVAGATTRLFSQEQRHDVLPLREDLVEHLSEEMRDFPLKLQEKLARRGVTSLLPIQSASFRHIQEGNDAVLHAPTGSGKTLAYVLPLSAAAAVTKRPKLQPKKDEPVSPYIVTLLPSRELAKQVGKEWAKYYTAGPVATIFGGVPLERHIAMLRKGSDVLVSTPGRLREMVREGHVDYAHIKVVVVDEADMLLDTADSPDVQAILDGITEAVGERDDDPEYQLLLVSATVNDYVRNFAVKVMEISLTSKSFIQVEGNESRVLPSSSKIVSDSDSAPTSRSNAPPLVQHWMTPVKSRMYPVVTADLIATLSPRLSIVFVPIKADTETVAAFLSNKLSSSSTIVRVLHGDMAQSQRSRTIALIRESEHENQNQILVATDVASRGLDLPNVDLVVQFGIPRVAGKDGTYNVELYTHRTGRAGRVTRGQQGGIANSVLLYDVASGEGKLVSDVVAEVQSTIGIEIRPRPIPSTTDIVEAGYQRAIDELLVEASPSNDNLISYVRSRLLTDNRINVSDPEEILNYLCTALVALSNVDPSTSPAENRCSLITGDPADRTLCVYREDGGAVTPTEVTKFCKTFGSGKLGRIMITKAGSAVLDLPEKRAKMVLKEVAAADESDLLGWRIEDCKSLPEFK
jgi:superfamily II DNA/RNA helicase